MMEIEKKYFRLTSAPAPHTVTAVDARMHAQALWSIGATGASVEKGSHKAEEAVGGGSGI